MFQIHPPAFTPLAPRNPNTCPYISPSMSSTKPSLTAPTTSSSSSKPPTRPHAPPPPQRRPPQNPLLNLKPATEQQQQRRRQAYLGKVRQAREDRRWECRSEMILRAEFLERKRAWEEERAREAAEALPVPSDEEEDGGGGDVDVDVEEVEMVDRILWQEEEEFEALVGRMQENECEMERFGSEDEEEWDRLFREVVDTQEGGVVERGEGGKIDKGGDGDGGMDMS